MTMTQRSVLVAAISRLTPSKTVFPLLACLALVLWGPAASADPGDDEGLQMRTYNVAPLTAGVFDFVNGAFLGTNYDTEVDMPQEIFACEEPIFPYGSVDELIELVKSQVAPRFWEEVPGAGIAANGEQMLVVRATEEVHDQVSAALAKLDNLVSLHVDVCAVQLGAKELAAWHTTEDRQHLPTSPTSSAARVCASITAHATSRCVVRVGSDEMVTRGATLANSDDVAPSDLAVSRYGFLADVRATPIATTDGDCVQLGAILCAPANNPTQPMAELVARWRTAVVVRRGAWHLAGTSGGWSLFVRTRAVDAPASTPMPGALMKKPITEDVPSPLHFGSYPIYDLQVQARSYLTDVSALRSPTEPRPEPLELPEPQPILSQDSLVELIQSVGGSDAWEDGTIQAMNGVLYVRNTLRVHESVIDILKTTRHVGHRSVIVDVMSYDLPTATPELAGVEPTHVAQVRSNHSRPGASSGDSLHPYIQLYNVELRETPFPIVQTLPLGLSVQLRATASACEQCALVEIRFVEHALLGEKSLQTPSGAIALPHVDSLHGATTLRVPMNKPTIAFRTDHNGRTRIITVTPRLEKLD